MSTEQTVDPQTLEETRQQLRNIVAEITALARENITPEAYFEQFLPRVVQALAAHGGAVWMRGDDRRVEMVYHINIRETELADSPEKQMQHGRMLQKVLDSGEPALVPAFSGTADPEGPGNPTKFLLVVAPLRSEEAVEGVIEIFQRPETRPDSQRGYLQFLMQMCESAGDWIRGRQLRQYTDKQSLWAQADHFSQVVHDSLDPRDTAYTIANEGRRLIGCDRVSVAIVRGRRCVIRAVSGQDTFDKRSNVITHLERLAARVVAAGDPLWYTGITQDLPPQLEEAVHDYVDEAHSKTVAVLPLHRPTKIEEFEEGQVVDDDLAAGAVAGEIIAALIIEQIEDERPREALGAQVDMVREHGARALSNALEHDDLFLMPVWKTIGKSKFLVRAKTLPKTVIASVAIIVVLLAMFLWPVNFDLKGNGRLQPVVRQQVFVDQDGVVTQVLVDHGMAVKAGDPLAVLRNTELEVRLADIRGQLETVGEQLMSVDRIMHDPATKSQDLTRLAGERAQLVQRRATLTDQLKLLLGKKKQLTITSPIDGQVITWNVKQQLQHRPVTVGQVLMTVAKPEGEWEVELFMPEKRMGYVVRERERRKKKYKDPAEQKVPVRFFPATDPNLQVKGKVENYAARSELDKKEGQSVKLSVSFKKSDFIGVDDATQQNREGDLRPGATITARVHCGRSVLGFYLFHELIEFVQSRMLF